LPTPTIGATTATQAGKYFNAITYSGSGSQSVTGVGFQPDWVWVKSRSSGAYNHQLHDAVRGATAGMLNSNSANAQDATYQFDSFDSDGFTTDASNIVGINNSGQTFVAWNWKANGAGVNNTSGSITSSVSASPASGFSVVTYTGQSGAGTVGHGLGVAPSMIIVKSRSNGAYGWAVWHSAFTQNEYILLEVTDAKGTAANYWNSSAPSTWTSAFGIGSQPKYVNNSGDTFVAYCFAEVSGYSKFGSYTGNSSADGPFVYCGFKPAFLMIKASSLAGESWYIVDSTRSPYNAAILYLVPNTIVAEASPGAAQFFDFLSNGFKLRVNGSFSNSSGETYIYMAFASNPFKHSLAR
jgi:hypothetical protein